MATIKFKLGNKEFEYELSNYTLAKALYLRQTQLQKIVDNDIDPTPKEKEELKLLTKILFQGFTDAEGKYLNLALEP